MAANDSALDLLESLLYKLFPNVFDSAMYASVKVAPFVTGSVNPFIYSMFTVLLTRISKKFQVTHKQSELRY